MRRPSAPFGRGDARRGDGRGSPRPHDEGGGAGGVLGPAREAGAVAAGGALGAVLRWAVVGALPGGDGGWPWGTLLVNVTGSLLIGLIVARLLTTPAPTWVRPFAVTGLLGGWTTYSALALDARGLLAEGDVLAGLGYLVATTVLGLGACLLGLRVGEARDVSSGSRTSVGPSSKPTVGGGAGSESTADGRSGAPPTADGGRP
ncbi:FluC/FEX family fluoride channel [Janibacter alkaliphilus]